MIKKELKVIQQLKEEFEQRFAQLTQHAQSGLSDDERFSIESDLEFKQIEAKMHIQNIFATGAELKDVDQGLVDFPSILNGQEVLLCWKADEDSITHYHGVHDGFRGRRPIEGH